MGSPAHRKTGTGPLADSRFNAAKTRKPTDWETLCAAPQLRRSGYRQIVERALLM